jgi:cytochrome c oxidase cbb3-type subunit 3
LLAAACQREEHDLRPAPARVALLGASARQSLLQPGGPQTTLEPVNPAEGNAYSISEGQRIFSAYNCTGCHAHGGGGIGPPLIKEVWIYGSDPANLFDTVVKGRPNGMPSWGGRLPEYQIWQIVTYIRSLNHLEPRSATPARTDSIQQNPHTLKPAPEQMPQ